jgi:hypothetical protein
LQHTAGPYIRVINRRPALFTSRPLYPQLQTYCGPATNDVKGQKQT